MPEFPTKRVEVAIRNAYVRPVHQGIRSFTRTRATRTKHDVTKRTVPEPRIRNVLLQKITFYGLDVFGIGLSDKEHTITTDGRRDHEQALNELQATNPVYARASSDGSRALSKVNILATLKPAYVVP